MTAWLICILAPPTFPSCTWRDVVNAHFSKLFVRQYPIMWLDVSFPTNRVPSLFSGVSLCFGLFFSEMVRRCVIGGCSATPKDGVTLYTLPSLDSPYRKQWISFILSTRKDHVSISPHTQICCLHFEARCFINVSPWQEGICKSLTRLDSAVPSIRDPRHNALGVYLDQKTGEY